MMMMLLPILLLQVLLLLLLLLLQINTIFTFSIATNSVITSPTSTIAATIAAVSAIFYVRTTVTISMINCGVSTDYLVY